MPIPQTTCVICGSIVNKSTTVHIGDGKRACKTHEGVKEQAQEAQEKITSQQWHNKHTSKPKHPETSKPISLEPHCCNCGKKGVTREQLGMAMLKVGMSPLFADIPAIVEVYKETSGNVILSVVTYDPTAKLNHKAKQFGEMFGFVGLCDDCMGR